MSRSYKKNVFGNWYSYHSMKEWRTEQNRKLRHGAKQIINTCEDWNELHVPVLKEVSNIYDSPRDGRTWPWKVPLLNQCAVDIHDYLYTRYTEDRLNRHFEIKDNHFKDCRCYSNKRHSSYWKIKRK